MEAKQKTTYYLSIEMIKNKPDCIAKVYFPIMTPRYSGKSEDKDR